MTNTSPRDELAPSSRCFARRLFCLL